MWSVVVALPAIQADFGVDRAAASLPYTSTMLGFAAGGVVMGKLADRFGITVPLAAGAVALMLGYEAVGHAATLWQVTLAYGVLIGFGCSTTFGPLMAEMSHWFVRRRGIAVALAASGNYLAGTVWPPVVQHFIATSGWRATHIGIGLFIIVTMLPLTYFMRRRIETEHMFGAMQSAAQRQAQLPFSPATLQTLLFIAGICLLRGDVDAAGAPGRLLRRPRLWRRARRRDAVADARARHRQPHRVGLHRRPHRRPAHAAARVAAAGRGVGSLSLFRRALFALRDLRPVRPVPGRHRAELRHHRARIFPAPGGEHARRAGGDGDRARHGAGRLDVGGDLRLHRLLSGGVPQRARLEPVERFDRVVAFVALARGDACWRAPRTLRRPIPSRSLRPTECGRSASPSPAACAP